MKQSAQKNSPIKIKLTVVSQRLGRGRLLGDVQDQDLLRQRHIFLVSVQLERAVDATLATTPRVDPIAAPLATGLLIHHIPPR